MNEKRTDKRRTKLRGVADKKYQSVLVDDKTDINT